MCLSPVHLRAKRGSKNVSYDVPCGHCQECLEQKKKSILFRAQYERKTALHVFFLTLTYDETALPLVSLSNGALLSVWSKQDVQKFHKLLRIKLSREYGVPSNAFRYFLVCERGKHGTQRPHYHGIYFLRATCSPSDFLLAARDAWIYGHAENMLVEEDRDERNATAYVTKYVTKEVDNSCKNLVINHHFNRGLLTTTSVDVVDDYHHYCTFTITKPFTTDRELHRDCDPFVLMSKGFGIDFLRDLAGIVYNGGAGRKTKNGHVGRYMIENASDALESLSRSFTINGGTKSFNMAIPRYYTKYLCDHSLMQVSDTSVSSTTYDTEYETHRLISTVKPRNFSLTTHHPVYYSLQDASKKRSFDKVVTQFDDFKSNLSALNDTLSIGLPLSEISYLTSVDSLSFADFYVYERNVSVNAPVLLERYRTAPECEKSDTEFERDAFLSYVAYWFDYFNIKIHERNCDKRNRDYRNNMHKAARKNPKRFPAFSTRLKTR